MINIFIEYLENKEIKRLYNKINFINDNYKKNNKILISKVIKNITKEY